MAIKRFIGSASADETLASKDILLGDNECEYDTIYNKLINQQRSDRLAALFY